LAIQFFSGENFLKKISKKRSFFASLEIYTFAKKKKGILRGKNYLDNSCKNKDILNQYFHTPENFHSPRKFSSFEFLQFSRF